MPFGLTVIDYFIISIIGFSILVSVVRGFVREALSLATWIIAFWIALISYKDIAKMLVPYIATPSLQLITAFASLFLIVLLIGSIGNFLITKLVKNTGLTGTDRLLGVIFGFARGALLIAVLLLLARMTPLTADPWWNKSLLIPRFKPLEVWLHDLLPESASSMVDSKAKK